MDPQLLSALIGLAGSLIGAGITYFATSRATTRALQNDLRLEEQEARDELDRLLRSIHDEIEINWDIYEDYGKNLETLEKGKAVMSHAPIGVSFPVYLTNSNKIGMVKDHDLRRSIITTYARAVEQMACIQENNRMLDRLDFLTDNSRHEHFGSPTPATIQLREQLDYYGGVLKENHFELKKLKGDLIRRLHKYGVLTEGSGASKLLND